MAEVIFEYEYEEDSGDIVEIHVYKVPKSEKQPDGISYTMVFVRNGERVVGYDNFEGHVFEGGSHHKHIKDRILPYSYIDEWKAIEDFLIDVEKAKRGLR